MSDDSQDEGPVSPPKRTQLLSDDPVPQDAFEGGHQRVARALAGLIAEEEGGKAIALTGPYGSGKSTVIEILRGDDEEGVQGELEKREKESDTDTRIFTYDAWAHQGDPLRRSFIESLIEFLQGDWASEDAFKEKKDQLSGRKEEIETTIEPRLTWPGRLVAASLLLLPLGYALVGYASQDSGFWSAPSSIGLVIALLPFIIVGLTYLWWRPITKDHCQDVLSEIDSAEWKWWYYLWYHRTENPKTSVFNFFVREKTKDFTTDKYKTPDPTSIEFQETFDELLEATLRNEDRRLIIVVDNLDRLPSEEALSIWSTMRTFFVRAKKEKKEWLDQIWLITPFDLDALQRIWEEHGEIILAMDDGEKRKGGSGDQEEDKNNDTVSRMDADGSAEDRLQAFLNKTFQVRFRVAPPVLSDWQEFLVDKLGEAFEDHAAEEDDKGHFHVIRRLYELEGVEGYTPPTPRKLKLFVNRLSVLHRQRGGDFKLPILALYDLKASEISRSGEELLDKGEFLRPQVRSILYEHDEDDLIESLAALHFNVDTDRALQVLLENRIQPLLENGDPEGDLSNKYVDQPGFSSVLTRIVEEVADEGAAERMASTGRALTG